MDSLKVVAVASSEETRASLYKQLQELGFIDFNGVFIELSDAVRQCQETHPDVIIVDTTGRELDAGLFIQAISMNPENPCVIFSLHKEMDINTFREMIRHGAREFIQYPEDRQSLDTALRKHMALLSKVARQGKADAPHEGPKQGRIIAAFASKGGVGASTVAGNLAYELHMLKEQSVVFFDLDQVFCNSAMMLNYKPAYSLGDLSESNPKDVDEALLQRVIVRHESGIHVVVGSKSVLDDNDMISPDLLVLLMDYLVEHFDYIVVDMPTHVLDPYHQYIVERCDDLLLVTTPDIPSLYRTRQYLDLAQRYLDMAKVKLVLNRHNMKAAYRMSNQSVEEEFRYDVYHRLPNDWDLNVEANSLGTFISKTSPKSELARSIQKLAGMISGEAPREVVENGRKDTSQGLLGKLFSSTKGATGNVVR